jgi:hypothetical protein
MGRSIDVVQIPLGRETVRLPWASREALLGQFRHLDSMSEMRRTFENVGTSRPVQLTTEQKRDLLQVIVAWADAEGGYDRLPDGVYDLRHALLDDLADTEAAERKPGRRRVEPRVGHDSRKEEF